jgi:hypothetical protein
LCLSGLEMKKEDIVTSELIDVITQSEKYVIPEPIKTKLGYHIISYYSFV